MHNIYFVYARTAIQFPGLRTMKNNLTMYLKKNSLTAVSVQPIGKAAKNNLTAVSVNVKVVKNNLTTVSSRPYMTAVKII
jgi:hypothetical protein